MEDLEIEGQAWSLSGTTGTMAAALAANSVVFAMQATADSASPNVSRRAPLEIEGIRLTYTAIVAATTPLTAGRALKLYRGTPDAAGKTMLTGGAAVTAIEKSTGDAGNDSGLAGALISTTAGLTAGAFTRGTVPIATFDLLGGGAAGARLVYEYYEQVNGSELWIMPGEILVVSNPQAMDAALTWQLSVDIDYRRRER